MPHEYDELIDLVNENDQVIGIINRLEFIEKKLKYTRVVLAFIINQEGKLAILRRTADKSCSPLHLSIVGGGVQSGETYERAAKREIAEEAGIIVDDHSFKHLGYHGPMRAGRVIFLKQFMRFLSSNVPSILIRQIFVSCCGSLPMK